MNDALRLAPDTIARLENAARQRMTTADFLRPKRGLESLYFYGYVAETCLAVAYFRSAGFSPNSIIDKDIRRLRMTQARQLRTAAGEPLMTNDPHPIVGWARFLEWHRFASGVLTRDQARRLREAVQRAETIYRLWRPELRYKTIAISQKQLDEVRRAAWWLFENQGSL